MFSKNNKIIKQADEFISLLGSRGYNCKERLFRKLVEETGEYAEAMEYENGTYRKVQKFKGIATPKEKLVEEIIDVTMMGLCLAQKEGLKTIDVLEGIVNKLTERESDYQRMKDDQGT